jgi:hypothetical protein
MATVLRDKTQAQLFGLVIGAVFVAVGIVGFVVDPVLAFQVNPLHNVAHLVIGGLLVWGSTSAPMAKTVNLVVGIVYVALALLGFAAGDLLKDLLDANTADHYLHLVTGAAALYFGTIGATMRRAATA